MEEKTKVQQLVEIANWAKHQNPEFTKHFPSMRSIIRVYRELPADYDKKKSVAAYIGRNLKSPNYGTKQRAERLALIFNALFGFRYFTNAPRKYRLVLGLAEWKRRNGDTYTEVRCVTHDRCNLYDNFKPMTFGACSIEIKNLGDAKRAAEQLIASEKKSRGEDLEVEYTSRLKEAMKNDTPSEDELTEGIEVVL